MEPSEQPNDSQAVLNRLCADGLALLHWLEAKGTGVEICAGQTAVTQQNVLLRHLLGIAELAFDMTAHNSAMSFDLFDELTRAYPWHRLGNSKFMAMHGEWRAANPWPSKRRAPLIEIQSLRNVRELVATL